MQITAKNLDKVITDGGQLLLVRPMFDGTPHKHQLNKRDTVEYAPALTYNTVEDIMSDVNVMRKDTVALIRHFPNRPAQRYTIKFGEVL